MPNYNGALFLREALESLLAQEYPNFEIIVVDDCSTDESRGIIKEYEEKGVRIFRNDTNLGIPKTRNRLLKEVSPNATYIAILDSDDRMLSGRLEKQVAYLEGHPRAGAVGSWATLIDAQGSIIGERQYPKNSTRRGAVCFNPLAQSATMLRKEAVDDIGIYDERFKRVQDHEYFLRMLKHGWEIANIQEALTEYRIHKKEGIHGRARAHLWYGFRSRMRFLFTSGFFSIKGCIITIGHLFAAILPGRLVSFVRKHFFSGYDI